MQATADHAADAMLANIQVLNDPNLAGSIHSIKAAMIAQVQRQFATSTDPDGVPWEPLKYRHPPPLTLILTGEMLAAIYEMIDNAVETEDGISMLDPESILPFHWKYHQYGTSNEPQRRFLGWSQDTLDKAADSGSDELVAKLIEFWQD